MNPTQHNNIPSPLYTNYPIQSGMNPPGSPTPIGINPPNYLQNQRVITKDNHPALQAMPDIQDYAKRFGVHALGVLLGLSPNAFAAALTGDKSYPSPIEEAKLAGGDVVDYVNQVKEYLNTPKNKRVGGL